MEWIREWIEIIAIVIGMGGIITAFILDGYKSRGSSIVALFLTIIILVIGIIIVF